jgi:NADH dehydrogenase
MAETGAKNPDTRTVAAAGGTGFVGGAIARELASRGHRILVLSHRRDLPAASANPAIAQQIELRRCDVTQPGSLAAALRGASALVIALAFRNYPVEAPRRGQTFERVDAAGTEALVRAAGEAGIDRVVYISGAGADAHATQPWFRAKWRAEEAVRASGLTYTIFRPSWIYGPGDRSLNRFLGFARWLPFVPQIGNGRQRLAPVFIDDMAALVADSLETSTALNVVLEVGGPETLSMDDVIREALHVSRRRRIIVHTPVTIMKILTAPLAILPSPPMSPSAIDFVVQSAPVDTTRLNECLPRRLRPVREGLATYLAPSGNR